MAWHIIGSNGYIASNLISRLSQKKQVLNYSRCPGRGERALDLTNFCASDLGDINDGDFVIFLAAKSSPDFCRDHMEEAYYINVVCTKKLIQSCLTRNAQVLFFSSDVVVGSTETAHDETMPVAPVGSYGAMKREIELAFEGEPHFKVFRLSYVFSRNDKFMKYLKTCAAERKCADVFQALYRNVVYMGDVLDAIIALGNRFCGWENQIFHLSGPQLLCRADMAALYQRIAVPELKYETSIPDACFFEARPNVIETRSLYLAKLLGHLPTKLEDAMQIEILGNKENGI